MDLGTTITAIVFIMIVALPFIITSAIKNRKKRKMTLKLKTMAAECSSVISEFEFCSDFVIGLDNSSHYLFYYKYNDNREVSQHLCLPDFSSCRNVNFSHSINDKNEQYNVMDKIELCFYPYLKEKGEVSLNLYDDGFDKLTLTGELQFAEKWEKLLNERMKALQKEKAAGQPSMKLPAAEKTAVRKPKKAS